MAQKFYAYYLVDSEKSGVTETWIDCERIVKGKVARYKSFKSIIEANNWLKNGSKYEIRKQKQSKNEDFEYRNLELKEDAVYFDAGTGRGKGVEVRLTDYKGQSVLEKILGYNKINEYGNYFLGENKTNNFGELVGIYAALKYAIKNKIKNIYGDSTLVIDYWSNGKYNKDNLKDIDTIKLIKKVAKLRQDFQKQGGTIKYISGDINPADLGFHK